MTLAASRADAPAAENGGVVGDPWMFHMRRGNFAAAWEICDRVLASRRGVPCSHWPRHLQYVWNGSPLAGRRVLIRCYHGLGDTLQFIRFVPLVKATAREVIVWAQPALLPLLRTVHGVDRWWPLHDGAPAAGYDVDVESMELAHVFRVTPETLPAEVPYVQIEPDGQVRRRARRGQLDVGLVWSCGSADSSRCIPFEFIRPLLPLPYVRFHILQRGPALGDWPPGAGIVDGSDDVIEAGRLMQSLDLVITVDSFPVHLAGALGRPVWLLLSHEADWRWMKDRDTSPWYPTARLFRQPTPGDWRGVIDRVADELKQLQQCATRRSA